MYFHTDSPRDRVWLAAVLETAVDNNRSVRIDVDGHGRLKIQTGGSWSSALAGTPDINRDKSFSNVVPAKDYSKGMTFIEVIKDLIDMDALGATEAPIRHIYSKVIQEALDA